VSLGDLLVAGFIDRSADRARRHPTSYRPHAAWHSKIATASRSSPGTGAARREFTTPREQILNQSPELVDC